jgi:homoserine kinase type II
LGKTAPAATVKYTPAGSICHFCGRNQGEKGKWAQRVAELAKMLGWSAKLLNSDEFSYSLGMSLDAVALAALSNFAGCGALIHFTRLDRAGFSGCTIWRVTADAGVFCLKCWPEENPPPERLPWIHQVMRSAREQGLSFVPLPLATRSGAISCELAGCTWELMTWLPGEANYVSQPTDQKLENAFRALAKFHAVTRNQKRATPATELEKRVIPAIWERLARFGIYDELYPFMIRRAVNEHRIPEVDDLAKKWAESRFQPPPDYQERLFAVHQRPFTLQPSIRDLWHDHVLFSGDAVSGFVDFGAMRMDTPLVDISRLLGSFARDDAAQRTIALDAYSEVCPLSERDRETIDLLDHVSTWIAGWNWLEWLYVEKRTFPSLPAVRERLVHLLSRTPQVVR